MWTKQAEMENCLLNEVSFLLLGLDPRDRYAHAQASLLDYEATCLWTVGYTREASLDHPNHQPTCQLTMDTRECPSAGTRWAAQGRRPPSQPIELWAK